MHNIINIVSGSGSSPVETDYAGLLMSFLAARMLTVEAHSSNLKSKLLIIAAKVCWSDIYYGEQLC